MTVSKFIFVITALFAALFIELIATGKGGLFAWVGLGLQLSAAWNAAQMIILEEKIKNLKR